MRTLSKSLPFNSPFGIDRPEGYGLSTFHFLTQQPQKGVIRPRCRTYGPPPHLNGVLPAVSDANKPPSFQNPKKAKATESLMERCTNGRAILSPFLASLGISSTDRTQGSRIPKRESYHLAANGLFKSRSENPLSYALRFTSIENTSASLCYKRRKYPSDMSRPIDKGPVFRTPLGLRTQFSDSQV